MHAKDKLPEDELELCHSLLFIQSTTALSSVFRCLTEKYVQENIY